MKKLTRNFYTHATLTLLFMACIMPAIAQKGVVGFRFMPTVSAVEIKTSTGNSVSAEGKLGFGIGGFLGYGFNDYIGVQAEVIYSSLSQKYTEQDREQEINLKYLNIPLLLSLNSGKTKLVNFNLVGGPQIGLSVGSKLTFTDNGTSIEPDPVLSVKKGDLGFAYGAGVDFGLNADRTWRLGLGYRGVSGLFDISENSKTLSTENYYLLDKSKVQTHAGYLGISFLF